MIVFLNGNYVPEENAVVSVFDRGFLYGDGLFETILIHQSTPFRWHQHMDRLSAGAEVLQIRSPWPTSELELCLKQLVSRNAFLHGLCRVSLSRGIGPRGYSCRGAERPTVVMSLHPTTDVLSQSSSPAPWHLMTSSFHIGKADPLARLKTSNKLPQIIARAEAEQAGYHEGLLLNTDGEVLEATSGNLFWVEGNSIATPPLSSELLPGITRQVVFELCHSLNIPCHERPAKHDTLLAADGLFLTLSSLGLIPIRRLDTHDYLVPDLIGRLHTAYVELVKKETLTIPPMIP